MAKEENRKFKVPVRRVDTSDCVINIGRKIEGTRVVDPGTPVKVHDGEWVDVLAVTSISQLVAYGELANIKDGPGMPANVSSYFKQVTVGLSDRIVAWNWTDLDGSAMEQPYHRPDVIQRLTEDEILYLLSACNRETGAERKNDSEPSPSLSLVGGSSQGKVS